MLELGGLFYLWRLYSASGVTFFIVSESSSPTGSKRFSRPQGWLIGIAVSNCHAVLPKLYEGNFIFYMYIENFSLSKPGQLGDMVLLLILKRWILPFISKQGTLFSIFNVSLEMWLN